MRYCFKELLLAAAATFVLTGPAHGNSTLWTFSGNIYSSSNGNAPCPGLCGSIVPPRGPITITMVLDQVVQVENFSGPVTWYTMGGQSKVDFGYGPQYILPQFIVQTLDNAFSSSEPDQLDIFTQGARGQFFKGAAFSIHLGSLGSTFLNGLALPDTLDLGLTENPRGVLYFSETGATADNAQFTISSLTITPVPEPTTVSLMLAGLGLIAGLARRRKQ